MHLGCRRKASRTCFGAFALCLGILLTSLWFAPAAGLAQEEPANEAKVLFDEGVTLSQEQRWADAVERFERSLRLADRPSTRFNLVHAYAALGKPLEVARHALAFLSLSPEPHRAQARAEAQQALTVASRDLAILSTQALPRASTVWVDGAAPAVRDATRVYVLPGVHRLELRMAGAAPEITEVELGRGQTVLWPRHARSEPVVASAVAAPPVTAPSAQPAITASLPAPQLETSLSRPEPRWRKRLSIVSGTLGAGATATAVTLYALLHHRANELSQTNPYTEAGFGAMTQGYDGLMPVVPALATVGGVLMAQAVAMGPRSSRWGSRGTAITALSLGGALLGAAVYFLARHPPAIETDVEGMPSQALHREWPTRALGSVLGALSAPLLSYGVTFFVGMRVDAHGPDLARLPPGRR
jgi:hypothetical protein